MLAGVRGFVWRGPMYDPAGAVGMAASVGRISLGLDLPGADE